MAYKPEGRPSFYQARLQRELTTPEEEVQRRMRWDMPILSNNHKCSVSLDLPVLNCMPTKVCAGVCYASQGRQAYRRSLVKSLAINRMIDQDPERVARVVVDEAAGRPIRLAGSGDLFPRHRTLLDHIERLGGSWYGFTRRVDTHRELPELMFSIDASTSDSVLQYIHKAVPPKRRAYLRRPQDSPSPLEVAVTFPVHGPQTNLVSIVPPHKTDCPATRGEIRGCWSCKRCY